MAERIRDLYLMNLSAWIEKQSIFWDDGGKFKWAEFFKSAVGVQCKKIDKHPSAAATFAVSNLLKTYGLLAHTHISVDDLLRDMKRHGWKARHNIKLHNKNNLPQNIPNGAVIVWERIQGQRHIGFFCDMEHAISIHPVFHKPYKHHFTFGISANARDRAKPTRKIVQFWWHPRLEQ